MKYQVLLLFLIFATTFTCAEMQESNSGPTGILDGMIIKILESLRPRLVNVTTGLVNFETGNQEFGNFRGHFNEVTVEDLDKFQIEILQTSLLDIKNLTIAEKRIKARGWYKINGSLAFPLGKNDIHFFGDGPFRAEFSNFSISLKIILRNVNGMNVVKDLDIIIELGKISVHLMNLMGGKELENVFNRLINDIGLTVINYYKEPILEAVKPQIKDFINKILNPDTEIF